MVQTHDDEEFMGKCIPFGAKVIFRPYLHNGYPTHQIRPPHFRGYIRGV